VRFLQIVDPPLRPSSEEAQSWLRRELLKPEYHQDNLVQRLQDWVSRQFGRALSAASQSDTVTTLVALVLFALLAVLLALLLSRVRSTRPTRSEPGPVLTDGGQTAAELRARAVAAFGQERYDEALVDAFRALTVRQVERGRLDDLPGATAHEVAAALETRYPGRHTQVAGAAALFDLVRYGDRTATRGQAESVLMLDDDLVGVQ
jgi:hypothetical protein